MRSCDWTLLNLVCFLSRRIVTGEFELWTSILRELLNKPIYSTLFSFSPLLDKLSWIKYTSYMPNCNPPYCHANTRKHLRDLRDKVESAQIPQKARLDQLNHPKWRVRFECFNSKLVKSWKQNYSESRKVRFWCFTNHLFREAFQNCLKICIYISEWGDSKFTWAQNLHF